MTGTPRYRVLIQVERGGPEGAIQSVGEPHSGLVEFEDEGDALEALARAERAVKGAPRARSALLR